ncbi:hypothetical protein VN97_g4780 [Penicillium thymicola]|uniref:Uncharacterized protein n=1 Tax=Penicillium thymicola TaxID=293382 RepID=A0AAI9TJK9_PENTH|nr:hypothetical protein VN97_g4780 [Penicillium thymicola]
MDKHRARAREGPPEIVLPFYVVCFKGSRLDKKSIDKFYKKNKLKHQTMYTVLNYVNHLYLDHTADCRQYNIPGVTILDTRTLTTQAHYKECQLSKKR